MKNIIREIAQFQLIYDANRESYYIKNSLTREISFSFDSEKFENLMILDRNDFVRSCVQRAGNKLQNKIV